MRKLGKVLAIVFVALVCFQMNAQKYTVKAGYSLSGMFGGDEDETFSNDYTMISGYHAEFCYNKPINDYLTFTPGVLFTTKGMKKEHEGSDFSKRANLYCIEIPVTLKASLDLGNVFTLYCAAGPYIGVGIAGYYKKEDEGNTNYIDVDWGNSKSDDFRRLDYGLTGAFGVEIYSFLVEGSYDFGLSNIAANHDNGSYQRNEVIKISIGYSFGK